MISKVNSLKKHLEVSDEIYKTIINDIRDTIVEIDLNGNFTYASPQCFQMFGFKPHEVIGRKALRFVHPEDLKTVMEAMRNAIEKKLHLSYEYRAKHKDGSYVYVSTKGGLITREGKQFLIGVVRDITEKKIAEIKLKESEKKYRNIIENTKDAIVIIDFEGKLLYISPQLSKMLKGREITKNSRFFYYIHKDDVKKLISFYRTTIIEKSFLEQPVEFRIMPKHGDFMWISSSSKNYYDDFGNVIGFISTLKDITDKKNAEHKLEESEQKYRLITEESNDLIRVLNDKFELEYVNENSLKILLGYTKQELLGKNSIILNHPNDYKKVRRFMLKVFKNRENMHETRIRHKNGKWVWFENKAKMFTDEHGNQKYLYISRDITERKKAEKALKESEEKYRSLYENSPNAVVLTNEKGLILDINSSAERILGYKREDIIGKNYTEFNMVTYDQISTIKNKYKDLLNGIKPKSIELQIKRKNGNISWISFQSSMIKIDKEIIIESICQDITKKKKAENLIIEENKRLMELNKIKTEFISRASHELKTPITSIYGGSQILMELYKDQTCSDAIEFIELINRGGKRLKLLVDNLLDASRIDSDKLRLNLQSENITQIIRDSTIEIRYLAYKRNIIIEQHLPETVNIVVDKIRIEQVITNLISNAIKNTPRKGIILLVLEDKPDSVLFKVKDSGIGLTEKEMDKLFRKFGKIERIGPKMDIDIEGSGLGLYISKEIIDLHGGNIWVESEGRNKGATFYFKLFKK